MEGSKTVCRGCGGVGVESFSTSSVSIVGSLTLYTCMRKEQNRNQNDMNTFLFLFALHG